MNKVLLHTPEGVRDVYGKECAVKNNIESNINKVFNLYGYHNIQTPTFEYFDIFSEERGSVASKNLYKFFDREGNTLVLRPDVTPSIARSAAKYYTNVNVPIKLCYNANTYINNSEYQGKLKENTQLGCELIGDDTVEADAEIIAMVVDSMKSAGLEEFLVEIGQADFFKGLLEDCGFDEETKETLRIRIENKNNFGVEELLDLQNISGELKKTFLKLPELFGSVEVLDIAKKLTTNKTSLKAIKRLEDLYSILQDYGVEKYISFDLAMLSNFNYYTGIIFKTYTYGTGDTIVTGGRYDKLLSQFGKDASAVGFAVCMDKLLIAVNGKNDIQDINYGYQVVIYESEFRKEAFKLIKNLRLTGVKTEFIVKNKDIDINEYAQFKKKDGAKLVTYFSKEGQIQY